ncbi:MAG: metabolite traffic protein EboE [Kiritimatiellae bacterium]|nr:metabolite traffic protein EboE [Kiritimatiellia bacterium]MDD4736080.1 metabolite traffic protein EboE [Kiritimatiellia bacterium]
MKPTAINAHLTYSMNVHPGENLADQLDAVRQNVLPLKQTLAPHKPFGLGLRLSARAAEELTATRNLDSLKQLLNQHQLYVFTINGFPYGQFHGTVVKENVYRPDWTSPERLAYTCRIADLLAALLPEGIPGSISTVPVAYRSDAPAHLESAIRHLTTAAQHLHALHEKTGRLIQLALEPEPDCLLESTQDCIAFFHQHLPDEKTRRHLGICLDTCHFAVGFENPTNSLRNLREAEISIPKIQLSAALKTHAAHAEKLRPFCDAVYLHQTRIRRKDGTIIPYPDLSEAIDREVHTRDAEWRTHYHVPLYFKSGTDLQSTADLLTPDFFQTALDVGIPHFEIETYTLHVLPPAQRPKNLTESLLREYQWTLERMPS